MSLKMMNKAQKLIKQWLQSEGATALTEAVILFPVLISLMMAVYDIGNGIVINQKTITASQIIGDLITRNTSTTLNQVNDYIVAGEMALDPYDTASFGVDIAFVMFDEDGDPLVQWRETQNMSPDSDAISGSEGLGEEGDGVIVVTIRYTYTPFFANFVVDEINLREVAYLHGRRTAIVECEDCTS